MDQLVKVLLTGTSKERHVIHNNKLESYRCQPKPADDIHESKTSATELYRKIQHGGDIPFLGLQKPAPEKLESFRHETSDVIRKQLPSVVEENGELDEEIKRKNWELLVEEGRRRRDQLEAERNARRHHHDFYTPRQKLVISLNRYKDVILPEPSSWSSCDSPCDYTPDGKDGGVMSPRRFPTFRVQRKAKALYDFSAQNTRELSFREGDQIYILHQVDNNWFLAERFGHVGLVPVHYIQNDDVTGGSNFWQNEGDHWDTPSTSTASLFSQPSANFSPSTMTPELSTPGSAVFSPPASNDRHSSPPSHSSLRESKGLHRFPDDFDSLHKFNHNGWLTPEDRRVFLDQTLDEFHTLVQEFDCQPSLHVTDSIEQDL